MFCRNADDVVNFAALMRSPGGAVSGLMPCAVLKLLPQRSQSGLKLGCGPMTSRVAAKRDLLRLCARIGYTPH